MIMDYTIFAGVNGVGKTSLYRILKTDEDLGQRVNIDEIVSKYGDWRDNILQIKAARSAMALINKYIGEKTTFHQETTLPGPTILKQIDKARKAGYRINLYYVGVENLEVAVQRVRKRVDKGGHGVDEKLIRERFEKMPETLHKLMPLCDTAFFYDNTRKFEQVAYLANNKLLDCAEDLPVWFWEFIAATDVKYY